MDVRSVFVVRTAITLSLCTAAMKSFKHFMYLLSWRENTSICSFFPKGFPVLPVWTERRKQGSECVIFWLLCALLMSLIKHPFFLFFARCRPQLHNIYPVLLSRLFHCGAVFVEQQMLMWCQKILIIGPYVTWAGCNDKHCACTKWSSLNGHRFSGTDGDWHHSFAWQRHENLISIHFGPKILEQSVISTSGSGLFLSPDGFHLRHL